MTSTHGLPVGESFLAMLKHNEEEQMTQELKIGDRVKVTKGDTELLTTLTDSEYIDGPIIELMTGFGHGISAYLTDGWKIEKLREPLPTTPGSVIEAERGFGFLVLNKDQEWGNYDFALQTVDIENYGYEVIFDAGKVAA